MNIHHSYITHINSQVLIDDVLLSMMYSQVNNPILCSMCTDGMPYRMSSPMRGANVDECGNRGSPELMVDIGRSIGITTHEMKY